MNRNIPVQVSYDRTNKGVDIRNPSTANFLIDSADRNDFNKSFVVVPGTSDATTASADFQITKPGQNLITGFFTRMAMSEIEMTWNIFNVSSIIGNNTVLVKVRESATGIVTATQVYVNSGNYTVKTLLDALVLEMSSATGKTFTVTDSTIYAGRKAITITTPGFTCLFSTIVTVPASGPFIPVLSQLLGIKTYDFSISPGVTIYSANWPATDPDLSAYQYVDITCSQLASQQKLKDATTSSFDSIDVVYRWVFANDDANPTTYDSYGYPILQGYLPFKSRRYLSFPKQVRWDPLLPIGNLRFQTYTDQEKLLNFSASSERFEFKMLMLISEV